MAIAESGAMKWGKIMRSTVATLGGSFALAVGLAVAAPLGAQTTGETAAEVPAKSPEQIRCELFGDIQGACVIPRGKMITWITDDNKPVRDQSVVKKLQNQAMTAPRKPMRRPQITAPAGSSAKLASPQVVLTPVRSSNLFINFDLGSADVNPQAEAQAENLVKAMEGFVLNKTKFEIAGHTDSVGSLAYNDDLSRRRAETVARLLRQKGVYAENLVVNGYGYRMPLEGLARTDGRNRRVEIVVLKEEPAGGAAK